MLIIIWSTYEGFKRMYIYICMYIHMYMYTYMGSIYIRNIDRNTNNHIPCVAIKLEEGFGATHIHIHVHVHVHIHIYTYIYIHTHIYIYIFVSLHNWLCDVHYICIIYIYIRFVSIHASRNGKLGFDIVG